MKKVFIVTGGNRGLGEAFVHNLIKHNDVFVISISRRLNEEQKAWKLKNFFFLKADLSEAGLENKISSLKNLIGNEDVYFINNASIIDPISKIQDLKAEAIEKMISVNIKSTIIITKYLLDHFNKNRLSFINISSGAANHPISNWSLYCSSKAFIKMFYEVAETEYEQHRFFNIDPGVMDTAMQKSIRKADFPDVLNFKNLEEEGKLKSPNEVAQDILNQVL